MISGVVEGRNPLFEKGDQIAYVPNHADGDLEHEDVQFGFVTSVRNDTVFCRYWRNREPGVLRTTANSEGANARNIVRAWSVSQVVVDRKLAEIEADYDNVR